MSDRLFKSIDGLLYGLNSLFSKPMNRYCRLDTCVEDSVLVADDGSMISIVEVQGLMRMIGENEFESLIVRLRDALHASFTDEGYALQVVMDYDPKGAQREVREALYPCRVTANAHGLAIDEILDDWENTVSKWCASEHVWFVLWTRPFCLPPAEVKAARKRMVNSIVNSPRGKGTQTVGRIMSDLHNSHQSIVSSTMGALADADILCRLYDNHEALWWVRYCIDAEITGRKWKACIPGDRLPLLEPDRGAAPKDISSYFYPSLDKQIFPRPGRDIGDRYIQIGDKIHAPMVMSMPPQNPEPFNKVFRTLIQKRIPWRASFLIEGGGSGGGSMAFNHFLASVFYMTSSVNKKFCRAVKSLKEMELDGGCIIRFRATFDTWAAAPANEDDQAEENSALQVLRGRSAELAAAIQGWGAADVKMTVGDPLLAFAATVPALMPTSPAPRAAGPLEDPLVMLPITRPSSAWREGSILFRSPDGKLMPYSPGSSLQASWIDLSFAPMGAGKSVHLNVLNLGFLLQPGLSRLPWLSILDIGPSSAGLIDLVKALLPASMKHLAIAHRLKMIEEHSVNPFDTPLGCRKTTPAHRAFLVNLLSIFATPPDAKNPQDGVEGIARTVIKAAYDEFAPENNPKLYNPSIAPPEVTKLVEKLGLEVDDATSWWEIVDDLFEAGHDREASMAQRYAVPLLGEVAALARRDEVTSIYKHVTPGNEPITDFFWRACIEALDAYPILGRPTQFDIGEAKIVSLDLDEVAQGPRQTGVMFMLGRHLTASRFFLRPEDVDLMPQKYQAYHAEKIKNLSQDPKRFCMDEIHRFQGLGPVTDQITKDLQTAARESRKWDLHIGLASQDPDDFPPIMVELATSVYILGAGSDGNADALKKRFGLNSGALRFVKRITKPGASGAKFLGIFKTEKGKIVQPLTSSLGMQALVAFSSTSEDRAVRQPLYSRLPVNIVLRVMAKQYPGGVKPEVERRRRRYAEDGEVVDVIQEITDELEALGQQEIVKERQQVA